ncbi:uncharacterized protein LOC111088612 isoform X2 [Limulus polyphemus]|nr:uncharacterized protein LOC111088612 isoform X2 [Limulus polyphemus]
MRRSNVSQEIAALKSDLAFDLEKASANDELRTVESNLCFNMLRTNANQEQQAADLDSSLNINRPNANQELLAVDSNSLLSISRSNANQVRECLMENTSVTPEKPHEQEKKSSFQITSVTAQRAILNLHSDFCELNLEILNGRKRMDVDNGQSSEDTNGCSGSSSSNSYSTSTINSNMVQSPISSSPSVPVGSEPPEFVPSGNIIDSKIPFSFSSDTTAFSENVMKLQMDQQVLSLVTTCVTSSNTNKLSMAPISHEKQDRFKIVKLVSNDPVKRGRWACTDFTDKNVAHQGIAKCEMSPEDNFAIGSSNTGLPNALYNERVVNNSGSASHYLINQTYPVIPAEELTLSTHQHSLPLYKIIFPVSEASQSNPVNPNQNVEDVYSQAITFSNQVHSVRIPQLSHYVSQEPILTQTHPKNISEIICETLTEEKSISHQAISEVTDLTSTPQLCVPSTSDFQNCNSQVLHSGFTSLSHTEVQQSLLEGPPLIHVSKDENAESSASDLSSLAIDNKIEQAMDLVKSHLMLAVREEVEVLKEKIIELTEKISQLEYENGILKANASQETLRKVTAVGLQPFCQTRLQQHLTTTTQLASHLQHPR